MTTGLRRDIIVTSIVIAGSLVLFLAAFLTITSRIDTAVASIKTARATIRTQSDALATLANLKQDVDQAGQYEAKINLLLPKKEELLGVTRAIDAVARAHNVIFHFSFQNTGAASSPGVPGYVGFNLDADGTYENVKDFWSDMESKTPKFVMKFDGTSLSASVAGYTIRSSGKLFFR